jgi:hypothetical protein
MRGTTVTILGTAPPPEDVEKNLTSCKVDLRFMSLF